MFKYAKRRQVLWPVTIKQACADGSGKVDESKVKVLYELLSRSEAQAMQAADQKEVETLLRSKIKGWQDMADIDGNPLDFSADMLEEVLDDPTVERAFSMGLLQASVGAPAKN